MSSSRLYFREEPPVAEGVLPSLGGSGLNIPPDELARRQRCRGNHKELPNPQKYGYPVSLEHCDCNRCEAVGDCSARLDALRAICAEAMEFDKETMLFFAGSEVCQSCRYFAECSARSEARRSHCVAPEEEKPKPKRRPTIEEWHERHAPAGGPEFFGWPLIESSLACQCCPDLKGCLKEVARQSMCADGKPKKGDIETPFDPRHPACKACGHCEALRAT